MRGEVGLSLSEGSLCRSAPGHRKHHLAPKPADKPGSVPWCVTRVAVIYLGQRLPAASSGLPGAQTGRVAPFQGRHKAYSDIAPAWPCSRWGMPGRPCCHERRWSLAPPFHHHREPTANRWRLTADSWLSASLWPFSVGSPRLGVTQHRTLWSPDFPRPIPGTRPPGRLERQLYDSTLVVHVKGYSTNGL